LLGRANSTPRDPTYLDLRGHFEVGKRGEGKEGREKEGNGRDGTKYPQNFWL